MALDGTGWLALVLGVVAVAGLAGSVTFGVLWRVARRRVRRLEQVVAELTSPAEARRRTRLLPPLPTPQEAVKAAWETAIQVREKGARQALGDVLRTSVEELAGWAEVERPDLAVLAGRDGEVTLFFSDIEGSTALNERLGDADFVKVLRRHDRVVRTAVEKHDGLVVKTQGDGFMVAFGPAADGVAAAVRIQQALARSARGRRVPVTVRIGLHRGDAVHRDGDLFGRNVALAARVAGQAQGGQVLATTAVRDALAAGDPLRERFGPADEVALKGFAAAQPVHEVAWAPSAPSELSAPSADAVGDDQGRRTLGA